MHPIRFRGPADPAPSRESFGNRLPAAAARSLALLCLGGLAAACSTVSATNYLQAEWRHRAQPGCSRACQFLDPPVCIASCARLDGQPGGRLQIFARGGSHTVARGPCLLPLIPNDPPLLKSERIYLNLQFDVRALAGAASDTGADFDGARAGGPSETNPLRVYRNTFEIEFADGSRLAPGGLSIHRILADGTAHFENYDSNSTEYGEHLSDSYDLPEQVLLELSYPRAYSATQWLEIQPHIAVRTAAGNFQAIEFPRVRMLPARDYDYSPFEIPLYYGSVR